MKIQISFTNQNRNDIMNVVSNNPDISMSGQKDIPIGISTVANGNLEIELQATGDISFNVSDKMFTDCLEFGLGIYQSYKGLLISLKPLFKKITERYVTR